MQVRLCDVPTPQKEVFFAVLTVALGAMASWQAPGMFDFFHLQSTGPKLQIHIFSIFCGTLSVMYLGMHLCRAPLLRKINLRYLSLRALLIEQFQEARSDPVSSGNVQILMAYQTDLAVLERHYADALNPSRTHATAHVIGMVLGLICGVLQFAIAG